MSSRTKVVSKMALLRALVGCLVIGAPVAGCSSSATVSPYESCSGGDVCGGGLACIDTTLPVSSGYSGSFCTSSCGSDADCVQVPENYSAACVNGQCYLTCPGGGATCPYSQGCFTFDSNEGAVSLCTP